MDFALIGSKERQAPLAWPTHTWRGSEMRGASAMAINRRLGAWTLGVLAGFFAAGCVSRPPQEPTAVRWCRMSAERKAISEQVYKSAAEVVRQRSALLQPGSWAVVLDIDETVLDNSTYQFELSRLGRRFPTDWEKWVQKESAKAVPGAVAFTNLVKNDLGGRVVLITNRSVSQCRATMENLDALRIPYDLVLCAQPGIADKQARFRAIREGTVGGLGPTQVVAWVGDSMRDFPGLSETSSEFSQFGEAYFLLPNPMYGSWSISGDRGLTPKVRRAKSPGR